MRYNLVTTGALIVGHPRASAADRREVARPCAGTALAPALAMHIIVWDE